MLTKYLTLFYPNDTKFTGVRTAVGHDSQVKGHLSFMLLSCTLDHDSVYAWLQKITVRHKYYMQ